MPFQPKTYQEIMKEMIVTISKELEHDLFDGLGVPRHERGLRKVLGRLGVKSAKAAPGFLWGMPVPMVTFDSSKLIPWPKVKVKDDETDT